MSQPPASARESLQVLLPEVAPNWEQGNKTGVKVGLGRQRGASHPPVPHFGRLQSLPAHKGAAFALWIVRIKGGGGRAPAAQGKLSHAQGPPGPRARRCPAPSRAATSSLFPWDPHRWGVQQEPKPPSPHRDHQPNVGVPHVSPGMGQRSSWCSAPSTGMRAGKPPWGDEVGSEVFLLNKDSLRLWQLL